MKDQGVLYICITIIVIFGLAAIVKSGETRSNNAAKIELARMQCETKENT